MDTEKNTKAGAEDIWISVLKPSLWARILDAEKLLASGPPRLYSSKEIQAKSGVGKIQLLHWTQKGVIVPLKDAKGRGGRRIYSHQNLIEAGICRELSRYRIETSTMKEILDWLRTKRWRFYFSETFSLGWEEELRLYSEIEEKTGTVGIPEKEKELYPQVERLINEGKVPSSISREHTVWEFLSLYPASVEALLLGVYTEVEDFPDGARIVSKRQIFGRESGSGSQCISDMLTNCLSSVIVNLTNLKIEMEKD
ncbi:MAG: MerR family transcriptional regulator [Deltaproteobacteria bacterium]|nr:MerR family transcriptional regulator [Deltaproteobacteria bacterium]MBW2046040.1 MerR family transcriptional regulator [Deltaproteobacteria bacterium]